MITVSAPGKIHLLGEHAVVYGKPALLSAIDLRIYVTISSPRHSAPELVEGEESRSLRKIIEPIIVKAFKMKTMPPYKLIISSQIPIGCGLGSSAAVSAAYIATLLSFLKVKWDLELINRLAYEAEKVFHGNPSGGDNSTVVYGGLVWFRKETADVKIIQPLNFTIPPKLARNFVIINTGTPVESTAKMIEAVRQLYEEKPEVVEKFLQNQEKLVKDLLPTLQQANENELIRIIKEGEENLESIGVVSDYIKSIIREVEKAGGAAKICGAGGKSKATGVLLAYHPNKNKLIKVVKSYNLPCFTAKLGVEGLRYES